MFNMVFGGAVFSHLAPPTTDEDRFREAYRRECERRFDALRCTMPVCNMTSAHLKRCQTEARRAAVAATLGRLPEDE